ncbi:MAG: hypothetical protein WCI11_13445 [Candidatus Methylumidiphilus sp.]
MLEMLQFHLALTPTLNVVELRGRSATLCRQWTSSLVGKGLPTYAMMLFGLNSTVLGGMLRPSDEDAP